LSQPGVTEAAVLAIGEGSGKQLVAYVAGGDLDPAILKAALKARLPAYMVPAAFVVLARLPLNANGKVDRKALPAPETPDRVSSGGRPRNAVELLLTQIWQEVLGLPTVDIDADFFASGGHSLLTVRLMGCIRERFGRTLPVAAIYQHPTIAQLAPLLAADDGALHDLRDWMPLQPHGTQPPLYVLAGAGGHAIYFHALARHLGGDQPVFGLETPGLYDVADIPASVEAHAARLLATLRRHGRTGPYRFAGHSAGALVAFELARQLEAQGETVAQLIVLDALAPNPQPQIALSPWQALCAVAALLETLAYAPLGFGDELAQPVADEATYARILAHLRGSEAVAALGLSADDVERVVAVYHAMARNHAAYAPKEPLHCPILLAQTAESASAVGDSPDWGWQAYTTAGVSVVRSPGTHVSMLTEPHVAALAALLGATTPHRTPID
jgi:thioesterase domain-containing protein/acyl carrier protein